MSMKQKALIGFAGGVCLVLVKCVQASFYLDKGDLERLGAWLTAAALILIATIFTMFINEQDKGKLFMQGILAPSFLIALVAQAESDGSARGEVSLPSDLITISDVETGANVVLDAISDALFPQAYAQDLGDGDSGQPQVPRLSFKGSVVNGARGFLGRPAASSNYLFVVARATDLTKAQAVTDRLKKLEGITILNEQSPQVVQVGRGESFYIVLGDVATATEAWETKKRIVPEVLNLMSTPGDAERTSAAALLTQGKVVDGRLLSKW